jgi:feruloyl esterase
MEAQRFPDDYDGIVAGAPANFWTHLLAGAAWDNQVLLAEPSSYIPPAKLPAISAAATASCDAKDGLADEIISDPAHCHFDPAQIQCKGAESDSCLTEPQVTALKKIYAGAQTSGGSQIFPGFVTGGELGGGGWEPWITGSAPEKSLLFAFGTHFFAYMIFDDANWDFRKFKLEEDTKLADKKLAAILNATDPDLRPFQKRGGKLIIYHGWSDAAIPALNAIDYYQSVVSKMSAKDSAGFVRLFMVPGMQHCGGGSGPNNFGQGTVAHTDPLHDIDAALERWVEDGAAPEQIIATKYKDDQNVSSGVVRTRPLCPYPQVARWKGSGRSNCLTGVGTVNSAWWASRWATLSNQPTRAYAAVLMSVRLSPRWT